MRLIDADKFAELMKRFSENSSFKKDCKKAYNSVYLMLTVDKEKYSPTTYDISEFQRLKEKDTPKKITHQATLLKCCTCPSCLNVVDKFEKFGDALVRVEFEYCHFCGQKLDWD